MKFNHASSLLSRYWLFDEFEYDELVLRDLVSHFYDRNSPWDHVRIDWTYHVEKKQHEKMFEKTYRMSFRAFRKLQFMLASFLMKKESKCRTSHPVPMHSVVAIGIKYLTGAKYQDLADVHGVSSDTVYKCVHSFLNACIELLLLPYPLHLVGDVAYIESDHLITPFTGSQKDYPSCDAFNYYMSQCRKRIYKAFVRMCSNEPFFSSN